jgi:UPF0716 protein FxsA
MGRAIALGVPLVAVAEIAVFVLVGGWIGYGWALLAVLAASFVGMLLLRREGVRAWRGFIAAANAGQHPGERVIDGIVGLGAGVLLTVPGFVTTLGGLVLLTPPARSVARRGVQRWTERRVSAAVAGDLFGPRRVKVHQGTPEPDDAIEGEIIEPR